ncbi:MAG: hypothetical protein IPH62_16215 [Ignavibacteriae bacterium]|nr:hypothetical protein [Ignavibacteriota bacterium]
MNRIKILLIIVIIFPFTKIIYAQLQPGAKQISLSHSDVANANDVFSLFSNPAGLSQINKTQIGFFYSPSPFGIKELANGFLSINQPTNLGSFSIGAMNYGFELFKENRIYLGYSNNFGNQFLFGINAFYQILKIQNYGNTNFFNFSLGSIFLVDDNFSIGFTLHNILRNKNYSSLTTNFRTGITYKILDNAKIHLSAFKEINFPISVSSGIEYNIIKYFSIRLGIQNNPNNFSGGFGINYSYFNIDYAINNHPDLGLTHQVGIIINYSDEN